MPDHDPTHDAREARTARPTDPPAEPGSTTTGRPGGAPPDGDGEERRPLSRMAERLEVPTAGTVSTFPDPEWYGPTLAGDRREDARDVDPAPCPGRRAPGTAPGGDAPAGGEGLGAVSDRELARRYDRHVRRWVETGEARPREVVAALALWDEIRDRAGAEQPPCPECGGRTWTRERTATRCGTCGSRAGDCLGDEVAAARERILAAVRPDDPAGRPGRSDARIPVSGSVTPGGRRRPRR